MPDFDQNLNPIIKQESRPSIDYTSNPVKESSVPDFNSSPINNEPTEDAYSLFSRLSKGSNPNSKGIFVTNKTLSDNKRYDSFNPTISDQEDFASYGQGALSQLGNAFIKTGAIAAGTFAQSFTNIPNTISAIRNKDFSKLSGDPDGYEGSIDSWLKNMEDYAPNYYSNLEKENSYVAMIPFAPGSANFWGNSIIKNLGFTAGAIAGAALQDVAITAFTGGVGSIPLISGQIGKAALFLNKLFTGANNVDKVMDITKSLSISGKSLLNVNNLARAASYTKVASGVKYGAAIYGSAMTEAGVEARDGYRQVKDELLNQYKLENFGNDPFGDDLQEIENYATSAMNTRFGINMALLTVSNVIQFDNLFRSFGNAGNVGVAGSLTKSLEDAGKIRLKKGSIDEFEKKVAESIKGKIWEVVKPKLPIILSEGVLEEGGQFSAEKGTFDYYTRKYKNPYKESNSENWNVLNESIRSTTTGLSEQFGTKEGIQSMLIGAISSMITGGIQGKIDDIRGKGSDARLTSTINMLNTYGMTGILANKYSDTLNSTAISKEMKEAIKEGNVFKFKNLKSDLFFNYVNSRLGSDMHDVTVAQLDMLKDLSKEEFEKSFGMDFNKSNRSTVDSYVDSLTSQANSIKDKSDAINDTFINPFTQIADPKSEEEVKESEKYNTFEDWKTNLKYYATRAVDLNQRLDSIQESVSKINPNVSNAVLNSVSDRESLSDLAVNYEQEANRLNLTITEFTSASNRRTIREKIKSLRTISERINLSISNNSLDTDTFHKVLNFELNFQDSKKDNVVELENINPLYIFAKDINSINLSKKQASILFENLATEKGLDKFSEEADEIKNIDLDKVVAEKLTNKVNSFTNSDKEAEELIIGREYEVDKTKRSNVLKISNDRYKVTEPDGKVSFFKTKEEAKDFANETTNETSNLSKVKVIGLNENGTVKVEDVNGDILNIDPKRLNGYKVIKTPEETLQKSAEELTNQQDKIEIGSATIITTPVEESSTVGSADKRKDIDILFLSSTSTPSETSAPHLKRATLFLNNFKFFSPKDGESYKMILAHPNNIKSLGLDGIIQLSYNKTLTDALTESETNVDLGFLAQVAILQTPEGDFFVSEKGEKIGKVGEQIESVLDKIVFQTMTSASTETSGGFTKVREGQEEQADVAVEAYKIFRKNIFSQTGYTQYPFTISRGVPQILKINGKREDNHIGNLLGENSEKLISNEANLITIVTADKYEFRGELLAGVKKGNTLIKYGDLLDYANNKKLTNTQSNNIFAVINAMANELVEQSNSGKPVKINFNYSNFLQNVLYWRSKGDTKSSSQIGIDISKMNFNIGSKSFPLSTISENKVEITNALQDAFLTVNNTKLNEGLSKRFDEYVLKDGKLTILTWTNYQTYLLSSKYPNGSARSVEETPLITHVAKPTETSPSYKSKYSVLNDVELPYNEVVAKPTVVETVVPKSNAPMIGEYIADGKTPYSLQFPTGPVMFTTTISEGNVISAEIEVNDTITKIAENPSLLADINTKLEKLIEKGTLTIDLSVMLDLDKATTFAKYAVETTLGNIYKKQLEEKKKTAGFDKFFPAPTAPTAPVVTAPIPVSEVEAKKAELDKQPLVSNPYNPSAIKKGKDNTNFRLAGLDSSERMTPIELEIFKDWHSKNLPLIPFEVLDHMVNTIDGRKAWGVFEEGVAKFVKGGLRATEYHEIFEAIYNGILTSSKQQALLAEFKLKKGTFTDRESGKKIVFSEATDQQAKERIADDFADFRKGKLPARSLGEKIRNLFNTIVNFFKSFVSKPSLKNDLFKAIDTGKFKDVSISNEAKTLAPQYRAIEGLSESQTNDFVNDIVARVRFTIFQEGRKDLLFNPGKITGKEVFDKIKERYQENGIVDALGEDRYNQLTIRSIEYLRTIGVSFDADSVVSINDENANKNDYAPETFSTDWKKNSTGAIKFVLSTLVEREQLNQKNKTDLKFTDTREDLSHFGGFKLVNFSKAFATLLDKLHNITEPKIFVDKIIELARTDSNYVPIFTSLGGVLEEGKAPYIPFSEFKEIDWKYFIQFYETFTKQKPEALIQYTNSVGEVYTNNANIYTNINQTVSSWVNNMRAISKSPTGLISYDKKTKTYIINSVAIKKLNIKKSTDQIEFLSKIGVEFSEGAYNALTEKERTLFADAINKIQTYLGSNNELMTFNSDTLSINGQLRTLSKLYVNATNPNQDSTYFGVEGQRVGSFTQNNAPSSFENDFNESKTLTELLTKRPELNDVFSKASQILKPGGLFFNEDGDRIAEIKVEYIQGNENQITDKNKTTAKLSEGERYVQEINQNLNGKYYVLIPADSSTEWMMNLGNVISMEDVLSGKHWNKIYSIYNSYLEDEINLALENRTTNLYTKDKSKELRFLRDILSEKDVARIEEMIDDNESLTTIKEYITSRKSEIDSSIKELIETASQKTIDRLIESNQITILGEQGYSLNAFDTAFLNKYNLKEEVSEEQLKNFINFTTINYQINNIEFHKFIFGDPYQFKEKNGNLDETKRIKSFLSPRGRIFNMPEYDSFLNNRFNSVNEVELDSDTPGYHEYKPYTNTVTFDTVSIVGSVAMMTDVAQDMKDAFAKTDETDAMSWLMDNTHKEIALKEGKWSDEAEAFHQWQMAYTRRAFDAKKIKEYTSEKLRADDNKLLEKESPKHKLAIRKPIVSGNKYNKTEINLVLDKTSQMPLYYSMVENTNLENVYTQMFNQKVGYGIVVTGRKVGVEELHPLYNTDGSFNTNDFTNIIEVAWKSYGTQVETASEGEKTQTRGSQLTKMASMDIFDNGVASSAQAQTAYDRNKNALDALNQNAYNELLTKLGIEDLGEDGFVLTDGQAISETLMYEMMRRELSENAKDTIKLNIDGEFMMPFEASPSFTQIRSILYSLVNKALISPSMNGAPHVQVPVTMFEQATEGRSLAIKTDNGWKKLSKSEYKNLSEEEKKKVLLTDDTLKFYTKDAPYCEVLLPAWFRNKINKGKYRTDEELIKYLNSVEGGKILEGIGFRIPTQALSSLEVFRVKGFLPDYMGYTVVVPSEITTKAGSDFDIDKLNMYLKSVYVDRNGNIELVKSQGDEQSTKDFYGKVFDDVLENKAIKKSELLEALQINVFNLDDPKALVNKYSNVISLILENSDDVNNIEDELMKDIENLGDEQIQAVYKDKFVKDMYKKSLENEYYDSLKELLSLSENFNKLISPLNDAGLEALSKTLDVARGYDETKLKNRLIDRNYMTPLRHSFITGKRWVGIAAVNITNLSLRQKSKTYLDPSKIVLLSVQERKFVKDLNIILPHNTVNIDGNNLVSLSGTKTFDGKQFISERMSGYATAFVDIATNPFIMKIIKSDIVVSTFMFLESIGAGNNAGLFLNQPIIEKYLQYLDSINSKSVMSNKNLDYIRSQFPTTEKDINNAKISVEGLYSNIFNYTDKKGRISSSDNAEQHLILNEFIKYKILADQLFSYTQASNYDTTRFSSSDALLKKEWATLNAKNTNLISNIGDVLDKNFIGKQASLISKAIASFGEIIKTERPEIKAYALSTIKRYATKKFMSADDYEKISNLIRNSFLDYVIQNTSFREMIKPLLVDGDLVKELTDAKIKYPNIKLLQDLTPAPSPRDGGATSIQLKTNIKAAYDENLYVGMMIELRDSENNDLQMLYKNIVNAAILQGSTQSAISIRNIIPVEDYSKIVSPIINQLVPGQSLEAFSNAMFERNNFNNSELFTEFSPNIGKANPVFNPNTGEEEDVYTVYGFTFIPKKVTGQSRQLLKLSDKFNFMQIGSDFIKIPKVISKVIKRESGKSKEIKINVSTGAEITKVDYAKMKQKGNMDLFDNYYYKKVYTENIDRLGNKIPLVTYNIKTESNEYYYKLINVTGDGNRAVEYNRNFSPSVIDNGSIKTNRELSDEEITSAFKPIVPSETKTLPEITPSQPAISQGDSQKQKSSEIYSQLGDKTARGNVVLKPVFQQEGVAYAKSIGGVFSMRVDNSKEHYGNPFSSVPAEIAKGLIATKSTKESVEKYIEWVTTSNLDGELSKELNDRREWIIKQLKSGSLKNKPIVYYKELGEPSHATALDYLINKFDSKEQTLTEFKEFVENRTDLVISNKQLINEPVQINAKTKISSLVYNSDGSYSVILLEGTSENWKENVLEFTGFSNGRFQALEMGLRELNKNDLIERFGKDVIDLLSNLNNNLNSQKQAFTENQSKENTIESLRAEEQIELQQAFPSVTPVDGKIIKESLNTKEDIAKFEKIYDKYDLLITPLLKKQDQEIEKELKDKYELFPGVFANEGQKIAIDKLEEFLKSDEQVFTLVGRGGTGKTTIIKKITEQSGRQVGGITVSHKAKKVLGKSIGKDKVKTIASALAIRLNEATGTFEPDEFTRSQGKVPIKFMDIIIVDEASMVSQDMYNEIMGMKKRDAKVIFIGDNAQLPPIGDTQESPVFKQNKYTLEEIMRQSKGSPIISIGAKIANNIESKTPVTNILDKSDRVSKVDQTSQSKIVFINNEEQALESLAKDFSQANENPDFVKAITYNNEKHNHSQSVKSLNEKIRLKLWKDLSVNQFNKGEILTAYAGYGEDVGQDVDSQTIYNADDLIVKNIIIQNNAKKTISVYSQRQGRRTFSYDYNITILDLIDSEGKIINSIPVISNSSKDKYKKDVTNLFKTDSQLAYALVNEFANLEYGYAITSHKAQGSTYNNVYVFEDNILGPSSTPDIKSKNQSLYVAVSRPTTKLVMVSKKNDELDATELLLLDNQIQQKQLSSEVENNTESKEVSKSDLLKTLFVKDTGSVAKGSVVEYNDKKWIVWNISDAGKAQLIDTEGNKFSGTPNLDKLTKIGDYKTTVFDGTSYIVTQNENIYSLATGNQVFTSNDGSTVSKKVKIIDQIMKENNLILSETNVSLIGKPEEISEEEWTSLTEEERQQIIKCN